MSINFDTPEVATAEKPAVAVAQTTELAPVPQFDIVADAQEFIQLR